MHLLMHLLGHVPAMLLFRFVKNMVPTSAKAEAAKSLSLLPLKPRERGFESGRTARICAAAH
jgi:hypothetical protein